MKKITGALANEWYKIPEFVDSDTGEVFEDLSVPPEMARMSRRPGIGRVWFEQNCNNVFPDDSVYFSKGLVRPPKYFTEILKTIDPVMADEVLASRRQGFDEAEYYRLVVDGVAERVLRSRLGVTGSKRKGL